MSRGRQRVPLGAAWRLILADLGLDAPTIFRRARVPPGRLDADDSTADLDEYHRLCAAVTAESGDPALALRLGEIVSVELFEPALFAAICSPDMNTAASRLGEFKRLVGPFSLDVQIGPEQTGITYRCKHRPTLPPLVGLAETVFLVAFVRRATRTRVCPKRVVVQEAPAERATFAEWFGCPVVEGGVYEVVLTHEDATRPFLTHNAPMWDAFQPSLRRRMAEADAQRSLTEAVESALFELLPSGRTRMVDVARELGVGTRTLQRRLREEGTSWSAILERTRERLARHYLGATRLRAPEVSFLLGYEDPNSFFRAFQRWTGTSPEAWRARHASQTLQDPTRT